MWIFAGLLGMGRQTTVRLSTTAITSSETVDSVYIIQDIYTSPRRLFTDPQMHDLEWLNSYISRWLFDVNFFARKRIFPFTYTVTRVCWYRPILPPPSILLEPITPACYQFVYQFIQTEMSSNMPNFEQQAYYNEINHLSCTISAFWTVVGFYTADNVNQIVNFKGINRHLIPLFCRDFQWRRYWGVRGVTWPPHFWMRGVCCMILTPHFLLKSLCMTAQK